MTDYEIQEWIFLNVLETTHLSWWYHNCCYCHNKEDAIYNWRRYQKNCSRSCL